ncbi:hypothetical protein P5Z92_14745 [Staphylococcus aureus]
MSLRKSTQRYLESELSNYNYFDKDIARVRDEVLKPVESTKILISVEIGFKVM